MLQRWNIDDAALKSPGVTIHARPMFHGFDHSNRDDVFVRRDKRAFVLALLGHVLVIGVWAYRDRLREPEVSVLLEPEIKDFAVEEQPEPEPEEEPPPPPPPDAPKPKPKADKPKPKPKPEIPKEIPEGPPPEQAQPSPDKNFGSGDSAGNGNGPPKKVEKKPETKKVEPPPKPPEPKKKVEEPIDPTKPVDRPERASVPQPDPGNKVPDYPSELRDAGVEGEVVFKLHVHRDGTIKGAKILRATNTATGDEEKANADKLFKQAAIAVIKNWKYTPSKLDGEPISVWIIVNVPFKLTGGG